ncbi:hypothetical protein JKF63_01574 [Porcisia hertigi]|uniref:Transcription elongation factor n=1 Tax=Porcisia hertigi TaxID=2761500 RepID=A0A836I3Z2_9TRYP|nr:hypothetical protein JKF63_01574 [Porcisia hertigi]
MPGFVQPLAPSEAPPSSSVVSPPEALLSATREVKITSAISGMKRPRVTEPITHFLAFSSCSGTGEGSSPEGPSIGALVANEPCDDANSDPTPVSPKQAKVESAPTTPKPPYLNLPRKIVRKTPVSTPTSSLGKLTPVTPPTAASISPSCVSSSSAAAASKRVSLHQRWAVLMHGVLMKERQAHESDRVLELCTRIVEAIPGDMEQMKDTFQTLLFNIKDTKNSELRRRVVEGELLVERLVTMDDRELANPELRKKIEEKIEERSKDTNLSEIRKAMRTSNSTLFKCHACGARDSSWEQRQTRSGDEPMTVIITCNKCNTQWRKY